MECVPLHPQSSLRVNPQCESSRGIPRSSLRDKHSAACHWPFGVAVLPPVRLRALPDKVPEPDLHDCFQLPEPESESESVSESVPDPGPDPVPEPPTTLLGAPIVPIRQPLAAIFGTCGLDADSILHTSTGILGSAAFERDVHSHRASLAFSLDGYSVNGPNGPVGFSICQAICAHG